jgi:AcrR family transcriptional regulator
MRVAIPRAEKVGRNRRLVLEAARRVFLERGYVGATLDVIAEEAGFSKGVVYSQFSSKGDLFLALLDERIDERAEENEHLARRHAGLAAIAALVRSADRDGRAQPGWSGLLVEFRAVAARDSVLNQRYAEAHARTVKRLAQLIDRSFAEAGTSVGAPSHVLAQFILALGSGITLERSVDPRSLPIAHLTAMIVRAVGGK